MYEYVYKRLAALGYIVDDSDDEWLMEFIMEKVEQSILNFCNVSEIPNGLFYIAVDMAAGGFLLEKKASGDLDGVDITPAVKEISQGDTSVVYAFGSGTLTQEERLDALISRMTAENRGEMSRYRRICW